MADPTVSPPRALSGAVFRGWRSGGGGEGAGSGPIPHPHAALSEAAEVYFNAIQKIGEQALQSSTSQILGEALPLPLHPHSRLGLGVLSS